MSVEVGGVLDGKITGITNYGAFVALPEGKSGLVHISEIANTYVSDISRHLHVGQDVRVRVMFITPEGKINLSIKRAEQPAPTPREAEPPRSEPEPQEQSASSDFEDRLRRFMRESDSRMADYLVNTERPRRSGRRGK